MKQKSSINIKVAEIRAISLGFVNFETEEGLELLSDLVKRWNPQLMEAIANIRPNLKTLSFTGSSLDSIISFLDKQWKKDYPSCDVIFQTGKFDIFDQQRSTRTKVDLILATYCKSHKEKPIVVIGENLVLVPASESWIEKDSKSKGYCFIATAAYSVNAPELNVLRQFRDEFLLCSAIGQKCVHLYYRFSPSIANWIRVSYIRRKIIRAMLKPIVLISSVFNYLKPISNNIKSTKPSTQKINTKGGSKK
jgi:hypothetical protein